MKKTILIASALLVAVACNDQIAPEKGGVSITDGIAYFTSSMEDGADNLEQEGTKTLIGDGYTVVWEETDHISLRSGDMTHEYSATPTQDKNGRNTLAFFHPLEEGLVLPQGQKYYALYPHDETAQWDGGKVTFVMPSKVDVTKNLPFNPSVAYTQTSELKFKNIGSVIKFNMNTTKVKKVIFKAVGGESLNGTVTVNCENPKEITVENGSDELMLNDDFSTASYYASILPQKYSKGLIVYLFSNDGYQSATTPSFEIGRSERVEFGNLLLQTQGSWQGKTSATSYTIKDETAPGGFYYPLACGIDVAGEELAYGKGDNNSWDGQHDKCPPGWSLPTHSQIQKMMSEDNFIQYEHQQDCYWRMRNGSLCNHKVLWQHTNMHVISSDVKPGTSPAQIYRWQFVYTGYKENNVIQYYYLSENKVSSQAKDKKDNAYAVFRCVRDAQ